SGQASAAGRAPVLPRSREMPGDRVRHASCAEVSRAHERDTMKVSSLEAASAPSATVSRHALVVESDLDQRRRVVAQLSHWGYTPHAVASGEEALDVLGETRFALSLIALPLPGMSGIALIRRAPGLAESGPVIVVADSSHNAQIVEAIQAGADDVIRRPYTADDLETAIQSVAGGARH